jgi:glycosyltransferase involved in cell wall biosynthesis
MFSVLLQSRGNLISKPGGDTTQITNLKNGLRQKGVRVELSTEFDPDLEGYDIVHVFNITRIHETYSHLVNARKHGKPVVCTTIYHQLSEYNRKGRQGIGRLCFSMVRTDSGFEYLRGIFNCLRDKKQTIPVMNLLKIGYRKQQETVLKHADKVIFGSESERDAVLSHFTDIRHFIADDIVPVGIPVLRNNEGPAKFQDKYGLEDFVLCVGRIEDLKNQLSLLAAMNGMDIPLVLIGSFNPSHRGYFRKVIKEIDKRPNCRYFGPMDRKMLTSAYAAAKVHVLPSWFETIGLTSLEAGLAGCNVVSTNRGYAKDYLKHYAWYCDPSEPSSIKKAVRDAYFSPLKPGIEEHIKSLVGLEKMIRPTVNIYAEILSREL